MSAADEKSKGRLRGERLIAEYHLRQARRRYDRARANTGAPAWAELPASLKFTLINLCAQPHA